MNPDRLEGYRPCWPLHHRCTMCFLVSCSLDILIHDHLPLWFWSMFWTKKKNGMGVLGFFYPGTITEFSELYCISELWNFKVMKFYIFDRLFICVYCSLEYWIWYHVYTAWFVSLCRRTIASTNIAPDKYHPNILKVYTCISRTCTVVHDFCNLYIDFWHKCFAISSIYNTGK